MLATLSGLSFFFDAARKTYEKHSRLRRPYSQTTSKRTVTQMLACRDQQPYMEAHVKGCIFEGDKLVQDTFRRILSSPQTVLGSCSSFCMVTKNQQIVTMMLITPGGGEVYTSPYRFHRLFKKKEEKKKDKRNDAAGRPTAFLSHSNGLKKGVV